MARVAATLGVLLGAIAIAARGATIRTAPIACDGVIHAEAEGRTLSATLHGEVQLDLAAAKLWRITLESRDCWAAPIIISGDAIAIPVWPKGMISGRFPAPPQSVTLRFESPDGVPAAVPPSETPCNVDGDRWTCTVPRVPLDLRLDVPGFAPARLWSVDAADVGRVELVPGAAVAGFVRRDDGGPLIEAVVELVAEEKTIQQVKPNARGFFQFTSVPAGTYTIAARRPKGAPAHERGVRVVVNRETLLRRPLLLAGFAKLRATVRPPLTPAGHPWTIALNRVDFARGAWLPFVRGAASAAGVWERADLERESYVIEVVDESGAAFFQRHIEIDADVKEMNIAVDTIPVEGRLRLGGQPIRASMIFVGADAYVTMDSEDDGTFSGSLPREARYELRLDVKGSRRQALTRHVDVRRSPASGVASLDVDFPAGRVKGVVTDSRDKPLRGADVVVLRGTVYAGSTLSDDAGAFELAGLEPGSVTVFADHGKKRSTTYSCEASAEPAPLTIVIGDARQIRGHVLSSAGGGIAGAELRYNEGMFGKMAVSGPGGEYSLPISSPDPSINVVVVTPGFPVKMLKLPVPERGENADIVVGNLAGSLSIIPSPPGQWPVVLHDGVRASLVQLFLPRMAPGPPPEAQGDRFVVQVEPGEYVVCPASMASEQCARRVVPPRGDALVDMRSR